MARGARFSQKRVHPPCAPPLLTLPAELRARIYNLVLTNSSAIRPPVAKLFIAAEKLDRKKASYTEPETVLSLARTCKQLHNEVLSVYYGNNTFEFRDTYDLYRYLYMIGSERRELMQQVTFSFRGECKREAFELLGECASLRELGVVVSWETTKGCKWPQQNVCAARSLRYLRYALFGLHNLTVNVREVWDEYLCYPYGPDGSRFMTPGGIHVRRFKEENVLLLQDLLRSDVAKKG